MRFRSLAVVALIAATAQMAAQTSGSPIPTTSPPPTVQKVGPPAHIRFIVPAIAIQDKDDHIDLTPGLARGLTVIVTDAHDQLIHVDPVAVHWASGNAAIASVSTNGVVLGKKKGWATIQATYKTVSTTTRACVSPRDILPLAISTGAPKVENRNDTIGGRGYMYATIVQTPRDTTANPVTWGQCVHWYLGSSAAGGPAPDTARATVTNTGVVRVRSDVTTFWPGAAVGTTWPQGMPGGPLLRKSH